MPFVDARHLDRVDAIRRVSGRQQCTAGRPFGIAKLDRAWRPPVPGTPSMRACRHSDLASRSLDRRNRHLSGG